MCAQYVSVSEPVIALTNVRVVDGTGAAAVEGQTIVVQNGRIASVGPSASATIPAGARVLDLAGHTVLPGLIGMHDHTFYTTRGRSVQLQFSAPRLYLGSGITAARTTGGTSPYHEINMKKGIDAGQVPGPRMHLTGPYLTGSRRRVHHGAGRHGRTGPPHRQLLGRRRCHVVQGLHRHQPRSARRGHPGGARARAEGDGAPLFGVVPGGGRAGIDNLEHGLFTNSDYVPNRTPDHCAPNLRDSLLQVSPDGPEMKKTIREMVRRGGDDVHAAVYELSFRIAAARRSRARGAGPEARDDYLATRKEMRERGAVPCRRVRPRRRSSARSCGPVACSAPASTHRHRGALPGSAISGTTNCCSRRASAEEAIQIMTLNGARIWASTRISGRCRGELADLVVVRGNPVATPADIAGDAHVQGWRRIRLAGLLAQSRASW